MEKLTRRDLHDLDQNEAESVAEIEQLRHENARLLDVVDAARAYTAPDTTPIPEPMRTSAYGKLLQAIRDHDAT